MRGSKRVFNGVAMLVTLMSLVIFVSCNAFKDYYDEGKEPVVPAAEESTSSSTNTSESVVPNFGNDKTECAAIEKLDVSFDNKQGIIASMGWTLENAEGETSSVSAEKLGEFTAKIMITKELKEVVEEGVEEGSAEGSISASLTLVIKQTGESDFSVCELSLKESGTELSGADVDSGTIVIDKFNEPAEEGILINAAYFNISFTGEGAAARQIQGAYFVDSVSNAGEEEKK